MKRQTRNVGLFILAATMSLSGTTASFAESMPDKMEAETSVAVTAEAENETANGNTMHWTVVQAETEHDTPALSGSDSDNLYDSMLTLADKIEDLTTETKSLRGQIEEVQQKYEEEKAEELETEEETEEEQTGDPMDENKFLRKIKKSLKKRTEAAISYSESELGAMTNDELVEANAKCCEEERKFYEKYRNAVFENKDIQYLCGQYIAGLKNQFDAYDSWKENGNISLYNELWDAGYAKRACAVCELAEQYEVDFGDISEMQKKVEALEKKDENTAGTELGYEAILECQNCLNTLGFKNTADGSFGARTAKMLKRFQLMYGYGPVDGNLTEDVLENLRKEAAKVAPPETETETESETEAAQ